MDREELEALRRQLEEDYELDIAAIDRLLRRYSDASSLTPVSALNSSAPLNAYSASTRRAEAEARSEPPSPLSPPSGRGGGEGDDLAGSIRTMFSSVRK